MYVWIFRQGDISFSNLLLALKHSLLFRPKEDVTVEYTCSAKVHSTEHRRDNTTFKKCVYVAWISIKSIF